MSMYSGQGAAAFSDGLMQGYEFVDKAETRKQDREIKQQQADQMAKLRAEQIYQAPVSYTHLTLPTICSV